MLECVRFVLETMKGLKVVLNMMEVVNGMRRVVWVLESCFICCCIMFCILFDCLKALKSDLRLPDDVLC